MAVTDPPWVDDLIDALRGIDDGPRAVLPLASALDELREVADGAVKGRSPGSRGDVNSLREDIQAAIAAAGPALRRRLESLETPLRHEVGRLDQLLKNAAAAELPTVTARAALGLLSDPAAVADAWDDLVDAWSTGARPAECGQRQAILEDLLDRAGLDRLRELDLARDVLMNRGWGLLLTGFALDEPVEKDAEGQATLELPVRLARIRRFLLAIQAWKTQTIWFAFTGAALEGGTVRVGPVQFFSTDILDAPAGEEVPPELQRLNEPAAEENEDDAPSIDPFEEVPREDVVLARVDVDKHWPDHSPDFARGLVACVVALAQPPEYGWQMAPGAVTFEDEMSAGGDLGDEGWEHGIRPATAPDLTGALESLPATVFERLVEGAPAALELEQSVAWAAAVAKLPDSAQRVALGLRALEQALPPDPSARGWQTAPTVQRFLFTPWRDRRMIDDARRVLEQAIDHARAATSRELDAELDLRMPSDPSLRNLVTKALRTGRFDDPTVLELLSKPEVLELFSKAEERPPDGAHAWHSRLQRMSRSDPTILDLAAEALPELVERVPATTPWRAEAQRLLPLLGAQRKEWSATLENTFRTLLARAVRVRNAVLHGGTVPAASLGSVDRFVVHLTQTVNDHRVLALTESRPLLDVLEHVRVTSQLGTPPAGKARRAGE